MPNISKVSVLVVGNLTKKQLWKMQDSKGSKYVLKSVIHYLEDAYIFTHAKFWENFPKG